MLEISIQKLQLPFKGGYYTEERKITQMLEVDIKVEFSEKAFSSNPSLETTLDYIEMQKLVREEVDKGIVLLESLALAINEKLRVKFPFIESVDIALRKHPILDLAFDHIEVRLKT